MGLYPFNTNVARVAQTDVHGGRTALLSPVMYSPGNPIAADAAYYFTGVMKLGAYTLLKTAPDVGARSVTIKRTTVDTADTVGTVMITGTDLDGKVIQEALIPAVSAQEYETDQAFKAITSIVGTGWVISGGADTLVIGMGNRIGLPDKLSDMAQVLAASLGGVKEDAAPTVVADPDVLSGNTVKLGSALSGGGVNIYYVV